MEEPTRPIRSKLTPLQRAQRKAARNASYYDSNIERLREKARQRYHEKAAAAKAESEKLTESLT